MARYLAIFRSLGWTNPPPALSVLGFGIHNGTTITDRRLHTYAVVLVEKGVGTLTTKRGGMMKVEGPALFWLFPGERHSYGPGEARSWEERWAIFDGPIGSEFIRARLIDAARPLVQPIDLTETVRLFGALHSEMLDDTPLGRAGTSATMHRLVVHSAMQSR